MCEMRCITLWVLKEMHSEVRDVKGREKRRELFICFFFHHAERVYLSSVFFFLFYIVSLSWALPSAVLTFFPLFIIDVLLFFSPSDCTLFFFFLKWKLPL